MVLPPTGWVSAKTRSGENEKATSSAVISSPLWNLTPSRSFSSMVLSSRRFQSVASEGTGPWVPIQSRPMRLSQRFGKNTRSPTLDCSFHGSSVLLLVIF